LKKLLQEICILALLNYPVRLLPRAWSAIQKNEEDVTCLRSCLMKPEHEAWIDRIWEIITDSL
jgi:hypothetical protein